MKISCMAEVYIGTSGYDYPEWQGGFYPENLPRESFLEYYAEHFNSLELNYTYYKMPTPNQMFNMKKRTSGKVTFSVKACKDLTHTINVIGFQRLARDFKNALVPLREDNLLLCALFQFPQSFHYRNEERRYLDELLNELQDIPVVVEMRNTQWQINQVYNALRQRKVGWCITDNPELKNLPKLDYKVTSDIAYLRFHGRNAQMWYKGNNVTRYDYLYSDVELQAFVEPIKYLMGHSKIVQLFFNNHAKSQATINAKKLEMLLKE